MARTKGSALERRTWLRVSIEAYFSKQAAPIIEAELKKEAQYGTPARFRNFGQFCNQGVAEKIQRELTLKELRIK